MRTRDFVSFASVVLALASASPTLAITHTNDYKANFQNYRTCTDPPLSTCGYADVLSPSKFYLPGNAKSTVIHTDTGTVQLRIDAGGILTDNGVSYDCVNELFQCSGGKCTAGPNKDLSCIVDSCFGGSNHGAGCSTNSQCPGGSCTGSTSCTAPTCQGGPRDDKRCGAGNPACTSTADTSGWSVVFRGNRAYWHYVFDPLPVKIYFQLQGDGDTGCMKVCPFSLDSNGAINSSGLTCSASGDCTGAIQDFFAVELRDPDDEILGIPGAGPAYIQPPGGMQDHDPAQYGDCNRSPLPADCP